MSRRRVGMGGEVGGGMRILGRRVRGMCVRRVGLIVARRYFLSIRRKC